jgi:integrase
MLEIQINQYIEMKKAMGFKYKVQTSLLSNYTKYSQKRGDTFVRTETVVDWAGLAPSPYQKRNRLLTLRRFAISVHSEDKRHEIPPADSFGYHQAKRKIRHVFTSQDIRRLLDAASELKPVNSIRPNTYTTLFALLAVTGMRISEAIAFNIADLSEDGILIRSTKFRKQRLVPLHKSTLDALHRYLVHRKQHNILESAFFVSINGLRLSYSTVNSIFLQLSRSTGLRGKPGEPGACIHDQGYRSTIPA